QAGGVIVDPGEPEPGLRAGDETGGGSRIAAREQGHVMTEIDQGFGEPPDDTLGAAIELGGNRLGERGDLGNTHGNIPPAFGRTSRRLNRFPRCTTDRWRFSSLRRRAAPARRARSARRSPSPKSRPP